MPPNTNDAPDQNQPINPPSDQPADVSAGDADLNLPIDNPIENISPQADITDAPTENGEPTVPQVDSPTSDTSPLSDIKPDLAGPPPINADDIPASNRPTLDTLNNSPEENIIPAEDTDTLESEISDLPETAPIDNPTPPSAEPAVDIANDITAQAASAAPTPAPPAFPESQASSQPKKENFFSKLFKRKK